MTLRRLTDRAGVAAPTIARRIAWCLAFLAVPTVGLHRASGAEQELILQNKPVSHWTAQLKAKDVGVRREAAAHIATIRQIFRKGPGSLGNDAALAPLIQGLNDDDPQVRADVAWALGWLSTSEDAVLQASLKKSLRDPKLEVRCRAAGSLIDILGRQWNPVGPADAGDAGEAVAVLAEVFQTKDAALHEAAAESLMKANLGQEHVPLLVKLLDHAHPEVRHAAANAAASSLTKLRNAYRPAVPLLLVRLKDGDSRVRAAAAEALGAIAIEEAQVVPALIAALDDVDAGVVSHAARSLGNFGAAARSGVPPLILKLKHPEGATRVQAAETLGRIGADPARVVPALMACLSDREVYVRGRVALALAAFGPAARDAAPLLRSQAQRILDDQVDTSILQSTLLALIVVSGETEQTQALVIRTLEHQEQRVWLLALRACRLSGDPVKFAVPALLTRLEQKENFAGLVFILDILANLGPEAKSAVPFLIDLYGRAPDSHDRIRRTLEKIDPASAARLPDPPAPGPTKAK